MTTADLDYVNREYFLLRRQTLKVLIAVATVFGIGVPAAAFVAAKSAINMGAAALATADCKKYREDCEGYKDQAHAILNNLSKDDVLALPTKVANIEKTAVFYDSSEVRLKLQGFNVVLGPNKGGVKEPLVLGTMENNDTFWTLVKRPGH